MGTNLLFMDECYSEPVDNVGTTISSITGLLLPIEEYDDLLKRFYALLRWKTNPEPNVYQFAPELHGREFLPEEDDERKFKVLEGVVDLINDSGVRIYRVGFYVTKAGRKRMAHFGDPKMIGLCWFELLYALQSVFQDDLLIPVMDGLDAEIVRKFSQPVKSLDEFRTLGLEGSLSIKNSRNLIGEVFFADSKYSVFTQLADLASYLRNVSDRSREGKVLTPFKKQLLSLSDKLAPSIELDEIRAIRFEGKLEAPAH